MELSIKIPAAMHKRVRARGRELLFKEQRARFVKETRATFLSKNRAQTHPVNPFVFTERKLEFLDRHKPLHGNVAEIQPLV